MLQHEVYWYAQKPPATHPLKRDLSSQITVIGGGMAGLVCALELHKLGKEVVLIEKDFCGAGASGKSSGFITPDSEASLQTLVALYGDEQARKLWLFVEGGVELIRQMIEEYQLLCEYQKQDSLLVVKHRRALQDVEQEAIARKRLGFPGRLYKASEMQSVVESHKFIGALRYDNTFAINSYLFCQELKRVLEAQGVMICEKTPALRIEPGKVTTSRGVIESKSIVVCTDRALPELGIARPEAFAVQTFLALTDPLGEPMIKKLFPDGPCLTWDTDLIYHYFRQTVDHRLLVGGSNLLFTYSQQPIVHTAIIERSLARYLRGVFPHIHAPFTHFWSGHLGVSKDFLPLAGVCKNHPGISFVSCAAGLPWAAALGKYLADKLVTGRSEFDQEFSPDRPFPIPNKYQKLLSKPLAFALSHAYIKSR